MILTVTVLFLQLCAFLALHALPTPLLRHWLGRLLRRGEYQFTPTFSGRVALFVIATQLRKNATSPIALLPDYVCNIVHRAFIMAGWQVVTYRTDEILEADWQEILTIIDKQKVGVLVGASVFGSSALLGFLSESAKQLQLKERSVQVVIDIAQDIRLIDKIPASCSDFLHVVVSFNDKSFPGAMGGGILSKIIYEYQYLSVPLRDKMRLYVWFVRKSLQGIRKLLFSGREESEDLLVVNCGNRFDYSSCDVYPYKIEPLKPLKLQFILAIIGIYSLPYYQKRKKEMTKRNLHLSTAHSDTAAYLIISRDGVIHDNLFGRRVLKPTYAIENDPGTSLRPHYIIVHNKGFADER